MSFGHQIVLSLRSLCEDDSFAKHVLHGVVGAFDDDSFRTIVHIRDEEWAVEDWSEFMCRAQFVLAFYADVNLVVRIDCLVVLLKTLVIVAFVSFLRRFERIMCVIDCFLEPLFPPLFEFKRPQ